MNKDERGLDVILGRAIAQDGTAAMDRRLARKLVGVTFVQGAANMTIKKSWEFYVAIGRALMIGSKLCDAPRRADARMAVPQGERYNEEFGRWLTKGGDHEAVVWVKDYTTGKKNESLRTRLMECMRHLPEIEAWRATLSDNDRELHLNNPTNVLAAWRACEKNKAIASGAKKRPVKKPGSKEEIARLQQETDDQRAELKKVKAALVIMKSSASIMAAKVWEANPGFEARSKCKSRGPAIVVRRTSAPPSRTPALRGPSQHEKTGAVCVLASPGRGTPKNTS